MKELNAYRKHMCNLPASAVEAEAQAEKEDILSVSVSGGKPAGAAASDQTALFVRVSGEKTGLAYTQNLDQDPSEVLQRAFENSKYSQAAGREAMHSPESAGTVLSETERGHIDAEKLKRRAAELEKAITAEAGELSYSIVSLTETVRTVGLVNSKGCDKTYSRVNYEAQVSLSQETDRGHYLFDALQSAPTFEEITADYFLAQLSHWKALQLPACTCVTGSTRAVLDASVMCNIFATAWQMFSAPFYLSKNTPLAGKLGEKIFSDAVSIRDCPVRTGSGYQFPFDCEGSEGKEAELVRAGRLIGLLQTLTAARTMGLPTTGNAGRKTLMSGNVHTQVAAMPKNFLFMPGSESLHALIASLSDGIYIHESFDVFHSINIASGSFTIPCKGIVVKDGHFMGVASGLTMNGNVCDLLANVETAANDIQMLPMHMLKSYTVAAPSVLVANLQINGEIA